VINALHLPLVALFFSEVLVGSVFCNYCGVYKPFGLAI